jgi:hypothetical protein
LLSHARGRQGNLCQNPTHHGWVFRYLFLRVLSEWA